ncbi:MAG: DUF4974 domain-containing protein [Bacteroidota bacterium]
MPTRFFLAISDFFEVGLPYRKWVFYLVLPQVVFFTHLGFLCAAAPEYISYSYSEEPLTEVLEDLGRRYDLDFVYSQSSEILSQTISARSGLIDLDQGLQLLFAETAIEFRRRDTRVLLRYNQRRADELLSLRENERKPEDLPPAEVQIEEPITEATPPPNVDSTLLADLADNGYTDAEFESLPPPPPLIETTKTRGVKRPNRMPRVRTDTLNRNPALKRRLGQFSLMPGLSTNGIKPRRYINSVSLNLPAGLNGGLNGAEFGILFNGVEQEALGLQMALGMNYARRRLTGVQVAGLFNLTALGSGFQIAGLANVSSRSLDGTQVSGLLNFTRTQVGRQYSLGLNVSGAGAKRQIGLINFSGEVTGGQIGLINVADTVAGRSFGLLNFVKRGYNVAEIARDMTQAWSGNLKFGSYRFYNIVELSVGLRNIRRIGQDDRVRQPIWSIGYGFGWKNRADNELGAFRTSSEFVISHGSRGARWTNRLNLFLHFRHSWDFAIDPTISAFIGPTLVLHWTQLTDDELSNMQPWNTHIVRTRYDEIRFAAMIGLRFGVRLGRL